MKTLRHFAGLVALALPLGLVAQTITPGSPARTTPTGTDYGTGTNRNTTMTANERYGDSSWRNDFEGARAGDWEFTLGGSGFSNKDMDGSSGGVSFSVGQYLTDNFELLVRQSVNYVNPTHGGSDWAGSTRLALDYHFATGSRLRPFVGVNAGGTYGDSIDETFLAGVEGGLKFYVQPQTFVFAMLEYGWDFDDTDDAEDNFSSGGYVWSVGVGFNF